MECLDIKDSPTGALHLADYSIPLTVWFLWVFMILLLVITSSRLDKITNRMESLGINDSPTGALHQVD